MGEYDSGPRPAIAGGIAASYSSQMAWLIKTMPGAKPEAYLRALSAIHDRQYWSLPALKKVIDKFKKEIDTTREDMSVKDFKIQIRHIMGKTLSELFNK